MCTYVFILVTIDICIRSYISTIENGKQVQQYNSNSFDMACDFINIMNLHVT